MAVPKRTSKPLPLKGRFTSAPGMAIGPEYSPNALNVRFRFGEVRPTPGRGLFSGIPFNEQVQVIGEFGLSTGILWPVMMTTTKLFRRGNTQPFDSNSWVEVTGTLVPSGLVPWSYTTGEDHFFFCRGSDSIMEWDGNPAHQFDLIKNVAGFEPVDGVGGVSPAPRFLEYFGDRLLCANVVENGVLFNNRLRWPQSGDFRKWNSTLALGAGFTDIPLPNAEAITGMKALGDKLAVYSHHAIVDVVRTGLVDPAFVFDIRVRGVGCGAPRTVAKVENYHMFLGYDFNVWRWDGQQVQAIGDPIWKELQLLGHTDAFEQYFAFCAPSRREYWLVFADVQRGSFEAFIYDYSTGAWARDSFPSFTAGDEIQIVTNALRWIDLIGTWDDQTLTWEQFGGVEMPTIVGGRNDGSTMMIDEQFAYDYFAIGSIMDCILETEDQFCPDVGPWQLQEVLRVILLYDPDTAGTNPFEVGVSFTQGKTWTTKMVTPNSTGSSYIDFVKTGQVVRYRFREKDSNVQFRWRSYGYQYVVSGDTPVGPTS